MSDAVNAMEDQIYLKALKALENLIDAASPKTGSRSLHAVAESVYSPNPGTSQDENFDGWLPISNLSSSLMDPSEGELRLIRDTCRMVVTTSSIAKNIDKHRRNHIVGRGLTLTVKAKADSTDPVALSKKKDDKKVQTLIDNWNKFYRANKMTKRLKNWVNRRDRDGEVFLRMFKGAEGEAPKVRFIDPYYIGTSKPTGQPGQDQLGVAINGTDAEDVKSYCMRRDLLNGGNETTPVPIPAEEVIHDKSNADMESRRGIPSYYAVLPQMRRLQKLMTNVSVVAQIQSAIAMVRKHVGSTQAGVTGFINRQSDGKARTDTTTGKPINARKYAPGTVLDHGQNIEYEFPGHSVKVEGYIAAILMELQQVANNFVMPVEWLLGNELPAPLENGSPVTMNFASDQADLYEIIEDELFWMVQDAMGVADVETLRDEYVVTVKGPTLAIGKILDQARADQIYCSIGAKSPQTVAHSIGEDYTQERSNVIKHRDTKQDGEVFPGDAGNTEPGAQGSNPKNDGTTKKNGSSKSADGDGGRT